MTITDLGTCSKCSGLLVSQPGILAGDHDYLQCVSCGTIWEHIEGEWCPPHALVGPKAGVIYSRSQGVWYEDDPPPLSRVGGPRPGEEAVVHYLRRHEDELLDMVVRQGLSFSKVARRLRIGEGSILRWWYKDAKNASGRSRPERT